MGLFKLLDNLRDHEIGEKILNEDRRTKGRYEAEKALWRAKKMIAVLTIFSLSLIIYTLTYGDTKKVPESKPNQQPVDSMAGFRVGENRPTRSFAHPRWTNPER